MNRIDMTAGPAEDVTLNDRSFECFSFCAPEHARSAFATLPLVSVIPACRPAGCSLQWRCLCTARVGRITSPSEGRCPSTFEAQSFAVACHCRCVPIQCTYNNERSEQANNTPHDGVVGTALLRFVVPAARSRGGVQLCSGCYCEMQCVRLRVSCACHGRRLLLRACSDWRTLAGLTVQRPPISHAACSAKVMASNTIQFGSVFKLSDCPAPLLEHRRGRRSVRAFLLNHCLPACLRPGPGHPTGAPGPGRVDAWRALASRRRAPARFLLDNLLP